MGGLMQYSKYYNYSIDELLQEIYRQDETILTYRDSEAIRYIIEQYIELSKDDRLDERDDTINELEEECSELSSQNEELQDKIYLLNRILEENNIEYDED